MKTPKRHPPLISGQQKITANHLERLAFNHCQFY